MKLNEWIRVFALITILILITVLLSNVFERKDSLKVWNNFYAQEKDSLDIVIIGSSLISCAIDPYVLSKETGCTTFNLGIPGEAASVHATEVKEIMKTQKPDLIIVESFRYVGVGRMDVDSATNCIAGLKPSIDKYYLIAGLPVHGNKFNRLEVMVPLLAHHNRWEDLTANDFKSRDSYKSELAWWNDGYKTGAVSVDEFTPGNSEVTTMDTMLKRKLEETVTAAKENNVKLLFFNPPNPELKEEDYGHYNAMYQYLDEQGVDWIECNYYPEFISTMDINNDYCDYHHVNINGERKTTAFLAEYINSHYSFEGNFSEDLPQYQVYLNN